VRRVDYNPDLSSLNWRSHRRRCSVQQVRGVYPVRLAQIEHYCASVWAKNTERPEDFQGHLGLRRRHQRPTNITVFWIQQNARRRLSCCGSSRIEPTRTDNKTFPVSSPQTFQDLRLIDKVAQVEARSYLPCKVVFLAIREEYPFSP